MKRYLLVAFSVAVAVVSSHAQAPSWVAPVGIPHPGQWFLNASTNTQQVTSGGGDRTFTGNGSANSPVVFSGVGNPVFTGRVTISGSYVIVEGIVVEGGIVRFSGDHLAL